MIPQTKYMDERMKIDDEVQRQYDKDRLRSSPGNPFGLVSSMTLSGVKPILSNAAEQWERFQTERSGSAGHSNDNDSQVGVPWIASPPPPLFVEESEVPAYDPAAAGSPKVWNYSANFFTWNKYEKKKYKRVPVKADFLNIHRFFLVRPTVTGSSIALLLGEPEPHPGGWFRCPWLPFVGEANLPKESNGAHAWKGRAEWAKAWHGSKIEALYSIMYRGRLEPSMSIGRGDRYLWSGNVPLLGVYAFSDQLKAKAYQYSRFVPLFGDGTFWNCVWEVRVDRSHRIGLKGKDTDQWIQSPESVLLEALWFCARSVDELESGWEVNRKWEPLEEASPVARIWDETVPDTVEGQPDPSPMCVIADPVEGQPDEFRGFQDAEIEDSSPSAGPPTSLAPGEPSSSTAPPWRKPTPNVDWAE